MFRKLSFRFIGLLIYLLIVSGCASVDVVVKPGVKFHEYKNIAVTKFNASNPGDGQEVADIVSIEFAKKGYNLIERNRLQDLLDEATLQMSGLTQSTKESLKLAGVDALVVGSVGSYQCTPGKVKILDSMCSQYESKYSYQTNPYTGSLERRYEGETCVKYSDPVYMDVMNCVVSIFLKMLDAQTGEILFTSNVTDSSALCCRTPGELARNVMQKIGEKIPSCYKVP